MLITDNPTERQLEALQAQLRNDRSGGLTEIGGALVTKQLVAVVEDTPAGVASISESEAEGELYKLYVSPNFRGRGVGEALFDAAVTYARQQGLSTLNIEMVDESYGFWKKVTACQKVTWFGQGKFAIRLAG